MLTNSNFFFFCDNIQMHGLVNSEILDHQIVEKNHFLLALESIGSTGIIIQVCSGGSRILYEGVCRGDNHKFFGEPNI